MPTTNMLGGEYAFVFVDQLSFYLRVGSTTTGIDEIINKYTTYTINRSNNNWHRCNNQQIDNTKPINLMFIIISFYFSCY